MYQLITVVDGRKKLAELNVATYPHAKKEARKKIHDQFKKDAFPRTISEESGPAVSLKEFASSLLKGKPNG